MRGIIRGAFRVAALLASFFLCAGAGYQTYLLEFRAPVTTDVPDDPPPDWMCGRSVGARHCVAVSPAERAVWDRFLMLLPVCFLVFAGELYGRSRRER